METSNFKEEFERMLMSEIIPLKRGETNSLEGGELFSKLHDLVAKNVPSKLYRYRNCQEYNLDSFRDDEVYAGNPRNFNDPFDSLVCYKKEEILKNYEEALNKNWFLYMLSKINSLVEEEMRKQYPDDPIIDEVVKKMQCFNVWKGEGDEVVNQRLREAYYEGTTYGDKGIYSDKINEYLEFIGDLLDQSVESVKESCKIACFTERKDNMLMWSHYADRHSGFVLEYDIKQVVFPTSDTQPSSHPAILFPVIYSDKRLDATHIGKSLMDDFLISLKGENNSSIVLPDIFIYLKVFLNKAKCWGYENEWRLICPDSYENESIKVIMKPTAIYYGSNISSADKAKLSLLAKEKNIAEYQMAVEYYNSEYKVNVL